MTPRAPDPPIASMANFTDFALSSGAPKVTLLSEFRRNRDSPVTDFYKPLRETIVDIHKRGRDPAEAFAMLMMHVGDERAKRIYPEIIMGHGAFVGAHVPLPYFAPCTAAFPAGPGLSIAINPELGLVIAGVRHHVKLYLRKEPLGQKRVDFTIALMAQMDVAATDKLAVLDVRSAVLRYLSAKSASAAGWRKLSALVHIEAAGYAAGWGRV